MSPPRESQLPATATPRRANVRAGATSERDGGARPLRYRAIFISDLHLGTPGCQAAALLEFLRRTESDDLYLVGDIVDGWQLRRRWYWHQSHNDVIQKLLRKARKGTRVVFVPGNHDEGARDFVGVAFGDIAIQHEAVHTTADGQRLIFAADRGAGWQIYSLEAATGRIRQLTEGEGVSARSAWSGPRRTPPAS